MEKCKEDFYQTENKKTFFKKSQKMDCAKKVSETFPIEKMIDTTIYIIPNTNKIILNYPIFKLYATEKIYPNIIEKIMTLYEILLETYSTYEVHFILDTFTITAAERYKNVINMFCKGCINSRKNYIDYLHKMYIYYTPSMIESISTILKPFIDPLVTERLVYYSKAESKSLLEKLHMS